MSALVHETMHALIAGLTAKVWCAMDDGNDGHIPLADDVQQLSSITTQHFAGHRMQQELLAAVEAYQQWCMAAGEIKDLGQEYMYMMRQEFILLVDSLGAKDPADFAADISTLRADRYFGTEQETISNELERRDAVGQSFSDSASVKRFRDGSNYAGFAAVPCFHPYHFIPKQDAPPMVIAVPAAGPYLERLPCGIREILDGNACNVEIYIVPQLQRNGRIGDGPHATYLFRPQYFFLERDDKSNSDAQEAKYPEAGHSDNFEVSPKMAFFECDGGDAAQLVESEQRLTEQERAAENGTAEASSTVRTTATKPMQSPGVLKSLADRDLNEICYSVTAPIVLC